MIRVKNRTGHSHKISFGYVVENGMTKIRATCFCGGLKAPPRFDRLAAEEDGREHMKTYATQSMSKPPGKKRS